MRKKNVKQQLCLSAKKIKKSRTQNAPTVKLQKNAARANFQIIIQRNIFQTVLEPVAPVKEVVVEQEAVPTSLNLTLEGTAVGTAKNSKAIIFDNLKKEYVIVKIDGKVQDAIVKSIEWDKVIFEVRGKKEVLEMPQLKGGGIGALNRRKNAHRMQRRQPPEYEEEIEEEEIEEERDIKARRSRRPIKSRRPSVRPHRRVSLPSSEQQREELDLDIELELEDEIKSIEELTEE
ncbi:MAG: hypothetical protein D3923_04005 [Candidatus Electrothrix sp. AR3]|nr:hypothetical protein [Candidatus Electrothrix sp. AR3]